MPVHAALDPALIKDCPLAADMLLPQKGALTGAEVDTYHLAVENALIQCRDQLGKLRELEAGR